MTSRCTPAGRPSARRSTMVAAFAVALVAALAAPGSVRHADAQTPEPVVWSSFQGDAEHTGAAQVGPAPPLRQVWRAAPSGDGRLSMPVVTGGLAISVGRSSVVAVDLASGKVEWTAAKGEGPVLPPAIPPAGGALSGVVVYGEGQGASDSGVVALDLSTHRQRWRVPLGGAPSGGIAIDGDAVFAGARDGFVYRIDLATGVVGWRARAGAPVTTAIAVQAERVFCLAEDTNTGDSVFTAFSATNGHKLWTFAPPRFATGGSTPTVAGGTVYAGFGDGVVRAFRVSNGALRWQSRTRSPFSGLSAPAFEGRALFIADIGGGLYRFDAATGQTVWDYQFPGFAQWGSPLVVGGSVYLGLEEGDDGVLAGLRASDGHLTWERRTAGGPIGALASTVDSLLVPSVGPTGGLTAYGHDPSGTLTNVPSPTELHLAMALLDFAIAFLILGAALLALGRLVNRGRAGIPVEVATSSPLHDGDGRGT